VALTAAVVVLWQRTPLFVWDQWDSRWYLGIASHGYRWSLNGKPSLAFLPLYPMLIHTLARNTPNAEIAAICISSAAFAGASFYLYRFTAPDWGEAAATRSVWLLALFPTAFVTFAPYTEGLWLLCAAGALYHARQGQPLRSGLWTAAAILTRSTGLILIPVLIVCFWSRRDLGRPEPTFDVKARAARLFTAIGPPLLAVSGYAGYLASQHLSLLQVLSAQRAWHRALAWPWTGFTTSLSWLATQGLSHPAWAVENVLQLAVTVIFLGLTAAAWTKLSSVVRIYCAGFWLLVLTSPQWLDGFYAPLSSMDRFVLALFPLAGWAACRLSARRFRLLLVGSSALFAGSTVVHLCGGWVG
jgi:hypothetical protein